VRSEGCVLVVEGDNKLIEGNKGAFFGYQEGWNSGI